MPSALLVLFLALADTVDRETLLFAFSAEQGFDESCGLAALSCLLSTYWGEEADELSLARGRVAEKMARGDFRVSFADLAAILRSRGYVARAYALDFQALADAVARYAPVLVHYDRPEGHFALVLSIADGFVATADPAVGAVALGRDSFLARWSGRVLVAARPDAAPRLEAAGAAASWVFGRLALLERCAGARAFGSPGSAPW